MISALRKAATGSGAERWCACPGSVALSKGIVEAPKDYAEEGTRLHKEAEAAIKEAVDTYRRDGNQFRRYQEIENPFVRQCVLEVMKLGANTILSTTTLFLEQRLELLGSTGGIDCYWIESKKQTAFLVDHKFGVGVRLEAKNNEQMAFYACAIKEKHPEVKKVYVTLIQPRLEGDFEGTAHVTHWTLGFQTIAAWKRKFERALKEVEEAKRYHAGEWCKFCNAKPICHPYVAFNYAAQEEQMLPVLQEFSTAPETIERVAWMLSQEKRVTGWFPKAKKFLLDLGVRGVKIPGFEVVDAKVNRIWHEMMDESELVEKLKERGAEEVYKPRELLSFTYFEEQKINVADLVTKPKAGKTLKLVKE